MSPPKPAPACPSRKEMHSRDSAGIGARGAMARHARAGRRVYIRAYRCELCGAWHLTSQRKIGGP